MGQYAWSLGLRTLLVGLTACAGEQVHSQPEPPAVVSVLPSEMTADMSGPLLLQLSGLPSYLDYGRSSAEFPTASVTIGAVLTVPSEILPGFQVQAQVPSGLPSGTYDLGVLLSDGYKASLPAAFTIHEPLQGLGFSFQTITEQVQGVPFVIAIRALGPDAVRFRDAVDLWSAQQVTPSRTGPFNDGVLVMDVTLQLPGDAVTLTATDAQGRTGTSNPFRVRAR